ncbi:MAG: hypothetical protein ACOYN0_12910 [Phycisphaerales bacterium]
MLRALVLMILTGTVGSALAQTPGFRFLEDGQSLRPRISADGTVLTWTSLAEANPGQVRTGFAGNEFFPAEWYLGLSTGGRVLTSSTGTTMQTRRAVFRDGLAPRQTLRNGGLPTWAFAATDDARWVFGGSDYDPNPIDEREFATVWDTQAGVPTVLFPEQYSSRFRGEGGGIAIGEYVDETLNGVPFAWSPLSGTTLLNRKGYPDVSTRVISPDGNTIVGEATRTGQTTNLIIWDETGTSDWGPLPSISTRPVAVSNTGLIALLRDGVSGPPSLVWDQAGGLRTLNDHLATFSISVPSDWTLRVAGISADGRTFVGDAVQGSLSRAFIVTVPTPSSLVYPLVLASLMTRQRRRA